MFVRFADNKSEPAIHGFLHQSPRMNGDAIALTHGAGGDCQSRLLVEVSDALAASGFMVLRFDLPFRRARPNGPPPFGSAAKDRDGLRRAASIMREMSDGCLYLGGHSYGGRQASMLVSEEPGCVDGLLLLSYPLHPPRRPDQLRTAHFSKMGKPTLFVHGTRDPFGTTEEMNAALPLIPAPHALFEVDGSGHDLLGKKTGSNIPAEIATAFNRFLKIPVRSLR